MAKNSAYKFRIYPHYNQLQLIEKTFKAAPDLSIIISWDSVLLATKTVTKVQTKPTNKIRFLC